MSNRHLGIYLGLLFIFIGGMALLSHLPGFHKELPGALFFYILFAVFVKLYSQRSNHWWAVMLAGFCFTMGMILILKSYSLVNREYLGLIFFLGLGLTFFYLWSLRADQPLKWALGPAVGFSLLGVYAWLDQINVVDEKFFFAVVLLLLGGLLIAREVPKKR